MIEIYDNLLEIDHIKRISDTVLSQQFPWYYLPKTTSIVDDMPTLSHSFESSGENGITRSQFFTIPSTLLDLFSVSTGYDINEIIRIRANLVLPTHNSKMTAPHVDLDDKHHVILYYVNDVDGNTVLLNEDGSIRKEVEPKAGRFVLFDGSIKHCVRMPTSTRVVFNYNVILK